MTTIALSATKKENSIAVIVALEPFTRHALVPKGSQNFGTVSIAPNITSVSNANYLDLSRSLSRIN